MPSPEKRVALVTGASQGIGRAIALQLAQAGHTVALAARNEGKLAEVKAEIVAAGGVAEAFPLDVSEETSLRAGAKAVLERLGTVHILVNNAGITRDGLLLRMKASDFDDVLRANLPGAFLLTQALLSPGFIQTAMTDVLTEAQKTGILTQIPLGRYGAVEDIAAAVAFLSSEAAGYITGHTLDVNGGMYMG